MTNLKSRGQLMLVAIIGMIVAVLCFAPFFVSPDAGGALVAVVCGISAAVSAIALKAHQPRWWGWAAALLVAAGVACVAPIMRDSFPDISVTATGSKNPASNATEVYVTLVTHEVPGKSMPKALNWEKRGDTYVSYNNQPSTWSYRGSWSDDAVLRIVRHSYSGIADVRIGNESGRFDLFSPAEMAWEIKLPKAQVSLLGILRHAGIFISVLLMAAALVALAYTRRRVAASLAIAFSFAGATGLLVRDASYVGNMELVAFDSPAAPVAVTAKTDADYDPLLKFDVNAGASTRQSIGTAESGRWRLGIKDGGLRYVPSMAAVDGIGKPGDIDMGCPIAVERTCIYEVNGAAPTLWISDGKTEEPIELPAMPEGSADAKLYLKVTRGQGGIDLKASRAYVVLPAWSSYSRWIHSVRITDSSGNTVKDVYEIENEDRFLQRKLGSDASGGIRLNPLHHLDTGSTVLMKLMAVWMTFAWALAVCVAGFSLVSLWNSFNAGKRLQVGLAVFGVMAAVAHVAFVAWPALMGWDGFSPYIQSQTGQITLWYGTGYPLSVGSLLLLGGGAWISAWQISITVAVLVAAAALCVAATRGWLTWVPAATYCLWLPVSAVGIGAMTHLRDPMNGLLFGALYILGFALCAWKRELPAPVRLVCWLVWAVLALHLSLMRTDNLPAVAVAIAGFAFLSTIGGGYARRGAVASLVLLLMGCIAMPKLVEHIAFADQKAVKQEKTLYASTAMINPLTGMLKHSKTLRDNGASKSLSKTLDRVMDVNVALAKWTPYDVIYWHETNTRRPPISSSDIDALKSAYIESMKSDPALFLNIRMATFVATLGHDWPGWPDAPEAGAIGHPGFYDHLTNEDPAIRRTSRIFEMVRDNAAQNTNVKTMLERGSKWGTTLPQLLMCLLALLFFRRLPITSVIALALIARATVFFLFEPASVFFYLYDMHLVGLLLPILAACEYSIGLAPQKTAEANA